VLLQPHDDTVLVEPVLAGEKQCHVALIDIIDADGAIRLGLVRQHILAHWPPLQFRKGFLRGRGRCVGLWVGLHQIGDDTVKSLLRIYGVPSHGVGRVQQSYDLVEASQECPRMTTGVVVVPVWRANVTENIREYSVK
jgi:hypothetical protein